VNVLMQDERFLRIVEYLREKKTAKLQDIAELNGVSVDTVRRDFEQLEAEGLLRRVRGGAVFHNADITTQKVGIRGITHREEKKEIAALTDQFVADGQTVGLTSGTTCLEVARFLAANYRRLTVITNNLAAVNELAEAGRFTIIVPGGVVDCNEEAVFGDTCEEDILSYNIDVAFLGVHAISVEKGITDFRINQVSVQRAMIQSAKKRIIVADHSKFDQVAYVNTCGLDEVDAIISDSGLSHEVYHKFRNCDVDIVIPQP